VIDKKKISKGLVCLVLALGTALLYSPALRFDFVNYDDPLYVINNYYIRAFSWQAVGWCFRTVYASMWHPLTWLSHMLDFQLFGLRPGGHHATSVALHIFNSMLLFAVLQRMTKALWRSAMVAALFAWHPMHVESVAWISERKDVLSAFFWLLTIWAYVRYVEQVNKFRHPKANLTDGSASRPYLDGPNSTDGSESEQHKDAHQRCESRPYLESFSCVVYFLALFFFALGLMAKPMLVTLPFVLLLLDWWPLERLWPGRASLRQAPLDGRGSPEPGPAVEELKDEGSNPMEPATPVWRLLAEKIPFIVLSAIACILTLRAARGTILPLARFPLGSRLVTALVMYSRYIEKLIWPQKMVIVYPFDYPFSGQEMLKAALLLIVLSVIAIRLWNKRPFWLTGWLWYLGMMVPVIGLVQVSPQPMADRYTYLSSIGIFIIICWEGWDIASGWRHGRAIAATAALAALGACWVVSSQQLQYWRNPYTLHQHSVEVMPENPTAHADYAVFLRDDLQFEKARQECEKAIHLAPKYAWAHHILGDVYLLEGKTDQAGAELETALRLDPNRPDIHLALAKVALARKSPDEAAAQCRTMLAAAPGNPEGHCGLGQALVAQGKLDEAAAQYAEALRLAPQYPDAHYQFGVLLGMKHDAAEAISQYRAALALQPERVEALNNLAWILATDPHPEMRDGLEAVNLASRACALTHQQQPGLIGTLAAACAEAGSFDTAVAAAQKAHDLALAQGNQALAARNLELLEIYRSHHAYHER
jgi:tetratricopeptide (TPR) repeat protein